MGCLVPKLFACKRVHFSMAGFYSCLCSFCGSLDICYLSWIQNGHYILGFGPQQMKPILRFSPQLDNERPLDPTVQCFHQFKTILHTNKSLVGIILHSILLNKISNLNLVRGKKNLVTNHWAYLFETKFTNVFILSFYFF